MKNANKSTAEVISLQEYEAAIALPEGVTQADLHKHTGLSRSAISRAVNGQLRKGSEAYTQIIAAIEELVGMAGGGSSPDRPRPETAPAKKASPQSGGQTLLLAFLSRSEARKAFSVVTGPSGGGKSHVLRQFINETDDQGELARPDVLFIKARKKMSVGDLIDRLCILFKASRSGSNGKKLEALLEVATGRMLIVDEADLMVDKRCRAQVEDYIEIFRELHEAGCTVVLIGLPVLSEQITRCCETYVFSRIRFWHKLSTPSKQELERFWLYVTAGIPGAAAEAKPVAKEALKLGLFRYLTELARHTVDFDGDVGAAKELLYTPEV